jgi:hypothetical protein
MTYDIRHTTYDIEIVEHGFMGMETYTHTHTHTYIHTYHGDAAHGQSDVVRYHILQDARGFLGLYPPHAGGAGSVV